MNNDIKIIIRDEIIKIARFGRKIDDRIDEIFIHCNEQGKHQIPSSLLFMETIDNLTVKEWMSLYAWVFDAATRRHEEYLYELLILLILRKYTISSGEVDIDYYLRLFNYLGRYWVPWCNMNKLRANTFLGEIKITRDKDYILEIVKELHSQYLVEKN